MGHRHQWCSYPPEGEVRRSKTWDELEGDEEDMVTNARVLEDIEDLRFKIRKDPGFRDSSSWPTLTEWCSSCVEMRFVKFIMSDDQEVEIAKDCDVTVKEEEVAMKEVKDKEKAKEEPVDYAEKRPDAWTEVECSEPGAKR